MHVQCMSKLCYKFQMPASNTVGKVADTRTLALLQSETDSQMKEYMDKGKTICLARLCSGGIKIIEEYAYTLNVIFLS